MPGTVVTTATRGASNAVAAPSGQLFIAGLTERGDTLLPSRINGMADFAEQFGERTSYGYVYDALKTFFGEGGRQAYVQRVVGPAATKGALTLSDRAGVPLATLTATARDAGAWSSRLTVEVRDGGLSNTFRITVRLNGDVVEDRNNLASPTAAVAVFALSPYIRLTNLGNASPAPDNNPAVLPATALTAGTDDRAAVTASHYIAALAKFTVGYGDGSVAIPGIGATVHAGLIAHAEAHRRIALLSVAEDTSINDLRSAASGLDSDAAGLFAPWVLISDDAGGTRAISPEGFVAGKRAAAHESTGAWRVPAGAAGRATTLLGVDQEFTAAEGNDLDAARVSVIRTVSNSVRLYGWRSLSVDEANYAYLSSRDLLNRLVVDGEERLEEFVFAPIDSRGQVLSSVAAALIGMVEPIRAAGGLYELIDPVADTAIDPGYKVETGSEVNSVASLARNELRARLSVRVSPVGALVNLTIVKAGILAGL